MIKFNYGNLLDSGCNIIAHQVNCVGAMGAGLAKQIKLRWPEVYNWYRDRCKRNTPQGMLGLIDIIPTSFEKTQYICNLYAQLKPSRHGVQTDYEALETCLTKLRDFCNEYYKDGLRLGLPFNLGCGLAGGDWSVVYAIIDKLFRYEEKIQVEIWRLN